MLATAAVAGLALGAFAFGAALGDGSGAAPSAASRLGVAQLAGQRVVVGFAGTELPRPLVRALGTGGAAGVILFSDNLPDRAAGRRLVRRLHSIPRPPGLRDPLLVVTDQEGGLVKRLPGAPAVDAAEMGVRGASFSREQGLLTARNLREAGIGVDLAPVLDVARPGGTIAETGRAFGSTPQRVTATAVPFAVGLEAGGVAATAKHFPGLGASRQNTDFAVQRIALPKQVLRQVDMAPYARFIAGGGAMVMLSTAIYPAFSQKPAAFAPAIASGALRSRLGFEGVSITDALDSVAVRAFGGPAKSGLAAARAGVDLLLFTDYREAARARRALIDRLRSGGLDRVEFERSVERVLDLRHELGLEP